MAHRDVFSIAFSHAEYRRILARLRPLACDFALAPGRDAFAVIRHDVEFSMADALALARLDAEAGVPSTFFVQVMAGAYNPLAKENRARIAEMRALGCSIGLHAYISHVAEGDREELEAEIAQQRQVLEIVAGPIDRFSFHRPPPWVLGIREDRMAGLLNAYGPSFFEFSPAPTEIKYLADSRHRWTYGHPLDATTFRKFQVLMHPDEWSPMGGDAEANFARQFRQHEQELRDIVSTECRHFSTVVPLERVA